MKGTQQVGLVPEIPLFAEFRAGLVIYVFMYIRGSVRFHRH